MNGFRFPIDELPNGYHQYPEYDFDSDRSYYNSLAYTIWYQNYLRYVQGGPTGPTGPTGPAGSSSLNNLVDGNAEGSVRGIGISDAYTMGNYAMAIGRNTAASGNQSHSEGEETTASGSDAHAEGYGTIAGGDRSHAEGYNAVASGFASHAEGQRVTANGRSSHAEGDISEASGGSSHAEGSETTASGQQAHAEGDTTTASGNNAHAEGFLTVAGGFSSHAEGRQTTASGDSTHAEGDNTTASGDQSHAEGLNTTASGIYSHVEGFGTVASGIAAHAEGDETTAGGDFSHSEGEGTTASGNYAHAEGLDTVASGAHSHSEGDGGIASGEDAHAEGFDTTASGGQSHAEGFTTTASGDQSHAEGNSTSTNNHDGSHIMGQYGEADTDYSWFLAGGTSETDLQLKCKILQDGNAYIDVAWNTGGADYAEMFETASGKTIEPGYFVTFDRASKKIRIAEADDKYILGVVSTTAGFVGDTGALRWKDKYMTDEWRCIKYHEVKIPEKKDKYGNVIIPEHMEMQPVLNPAWDPSQEYIPRLKRPEWVRVGLLGKLLLRDDGSCRVGDYCKCGDHGMATMAKEGYRVLERLSERQILILFR